MPFSTSPLRRLWQPRRGLFWLMLAFNALSSGLAWTIHLTQPAGGLLVLLTALALANTAMGWWLLAVLWREAAPDPKATSQGDSRVQRPSHQPDR